MPEEPLSEEPAALLLQAVNTLPVSQRDLVLTWMLQSLGPWVPSTRVRSPEVPDRATATNRLGALFGSQIQGEQQVVPIRLPIDTHGRLRSWCEQHGFSMAGVVRGLVEDFLDTVAANSDAVAGDRPADGETSRGSL